MPVSSEPKYFRTIGVLLQGTFDLLKDAELTMDESFHSIQQGRDIRRDNRDYCGMIQEYLVSKKPETLTTLWEGAYIHVDHEFEVKIGPLVTMMTKVIDRVCPNCNELMVHKSDTVPSRYEESLKRNDRSFGATRGYGTAPWSLCTIAMQSKTNKRKYSE